MLARLLPFFFLGIMVVLLIVGIILFSYLLILGAIVGFVLFLIAVIKEKLFSSHAKKSILPVQKKTRTGIIIEQDKHKN